MVSPEPLVKMWLNILVLVPDWNRQQSVMYLMDVVIKTSFFYPDARATAERIFQELFSVCFVLLFVENFKINLTNYYSSVELI